MRIGLNYIRNNTYPSLDGFVRSRAPLLSKIEFWPDRAHDDALPWERSKLSDLRLRIYTDLVTFLPIASALRGTLEHEHVAPISSSPALIERARQRYIVGQAVQVPAVLSRSAELSALDVDVAHTRVRGLQTVSCTFCGISRIWIFADFFFYLAAGPHRFQRLCLALLLVSVLSGKCVRRGASVQNY